MKKAILVILLAILSLILFNRFGLANNGFDLSNSSIDKKLILSGGPAKDGIPAIDDPKFILAKNADFLLPSDRVLGLDYRGIIKAYPIKILNFHEIVNDDFNDQPVAITFCPLCGSGIAYLREINGKKVTFGVSGLLYNSDVLLYDRETESLWSQIISTAISGPLRGQHLKMLTLTHTTWQDWQKRHPRTLVLSINTGFSRDYSNNPYDGYELDRALWFPVVAQDNSRDPKSLIIGIEINGRFKGYPFTELEKLDAALLDKVAGKKIIINYSKIHQSASITDENGKLLPTITTFWFAWHAFHPTALIFSIEKH